MKAYGEWMHSSTILDLGTRWRCMVSFMPRPLYPRYHWIGDWVVGSRACLDAIGLRKVSYLYRESNPGPSLYQLVYSGFITTRYVVSKIFLRMYPNQIVKKILIYVQKFTRFSFQHIMRSYTRNPVEYTGLFFLKVMYWRYYLPSKMF
jgi:hypothetical protein